MCLEKVGEEEFDPRNRGARWKECSNRALYVEAARKKQMDEQIV